MKLLFVSNLFPDRDEPIRGLDNACLLHSLRAHCEEIRVLALRPSLSPVRLCCPGEDWHARPEDAGLNPVYRAVPYLPKVGSPWNHRLMAHAMASPLRSIRNEFDYDHILVSWLYPDGCAVARIADAPFTMICQGSDAHAFLRNRIRRKLIVDAIGKSRGVITRSADLARVLAEAGAAPEKLKPIYNGVDTNLFHPAPDKEVTRAQLGLEPGAHWLLFVGNFLPVKNPDLLLDAWTLARNALAGADIRLAMIGGGPLEGAIRARAESLGCASALHLAGQQPSAVVADYMRAADLLCISSHSEGVPNVVLEALASGLRVVSTDVGGLSEILDRPLLGELVQAGDVKALGTAITHSLENPIDPAAIAGHAQQYSWQETAVRYHNVLTEGRFTD